MGPNEPSRRVEVLGIPIAEIDLDGLLEFILDSVEAGKGGSEEPVTVAYANAYSCNLAATNGAYRHALNQVDLVYLDGNGPRIAAYLAGKRLGPRMTAPDWFDELCRQCSQRGISFYFLGALPGVSESAAARIVERFPDLEIVGCEDGFFDPRDSRAVVRRINRAQPGILLVGMGSPLQELWMFENRDQIEAPLIWTAGGLLDYVSGRIKRAPAWTRALGLEWLGRLLLEPRRLAPRYLLGIPLFLLRTVSYVLRARLGSRGSQPNR